MEPFLKWAGGKRWLVAQREFHAPLFSGRYIEPFLGGGAVFFKLLPKNAILSDLNPDLINAYKVVRDFPEELIFELNRHQESHSKSYYYDVRASRPDSAVSLAAKFIYLNKTCWNGLYRVNLRGEFNVPIGTKSNIVGSDNYFELSDALRESVIVCEDFESILSKSEAGDFIFLDPPYTVKHNSNGFVKYNELLFSWNDQERLKVAVDAAAERGAFFLMTNADHASIKELYIDYSREAMTRSSVISGLSHGRGKYNELIIKNW